MARTVGRQPVKIAQRLKKEWDKDAAEQVETQLKQLDSRESSRYIADGFYTNDIPATTSDAFLRFTGPAFQDSSHVVHRPSSVTALWCLLSASPASGTLTVTLMKNGSPVAGMSVSYTGGTAVLQVKAVPAGQVAVVAGDILEVSFDSVSLSPTTLDARAGIELSDS